LGQARNLLKLTLGVTALAGGVMTMDNGQISKQKQAQLFIINK
jgi:hypothetical protein